jgi:hypothetical protein
MKQLPDKFQFRVDTHPGYTHTATRLAHGAYEINWARGWHKAIDKIKWLTCTADEVQHWVSTEGWIIVDDTPKQKETEANLPDEFYAAHDPNSEVIWRMKKEGEFWFAHYKGNRNSATYNEKWLRNVLKEGLWCIVDKPALTAEQKRDLKDFEEQIAQLNSAIRLNEQTIEHHNRMIANYLQRQDDLRDKIKELEGV